MGFCLFSNVAVAARAAQAAGLRRVAVVDFDVHHGNGTQAAFERLMPALDGFEPDIILISAGFDAHARDPLAQQQLEAEDFAWATRAVMTVARARSKGRVVSSLEGGYDLEALGRSAAAHVRALQAA